MENIWKILNKESTAAPSRRQIDVSAQHSEPIISPQNDASSGHNDISDWTPFFFFLNNLVSLTEKRSLIIERKSFRSLSTSLSNFD